MTEAERIAAAEELAAVLSAKLRALVTAVEGYLDHPGCNNPARATAMRKLRWAMEQAKED